ncbi:MAG TPA: RNA polymerase sigma factor [Verrucomicrobiae bacterium]|nr:RNA polymerase sigma factor [Verrucomicrobiae bacterium]
MKRVNGGEHAGERDPEWRDWADQSGPGFLLFARQQARCEADAQDLVQEAVVESWRQQGGGGPPPAGLVYATIRRRAVDWARRDDRRGRREIAAHGEAPEYWFDGALEDRERGRLIQEALGQLPEIYRDVVTLKVWGELTFAEIAAALEIPLNTASSRYRYGLMELRKRTKEALV